MRRLTPACCRGGGFMLLRNASGHAEVIDFREMAPAAATQDMFVTVSAWDDMQAGTQLVWGLLVCKAVNSISCWDRMATAPTPRGRCQISAPRALGAWRQVCLPRSWHTTLLDTSPCLAHHLA